MNRRDRRDVDSFHAVSSGSGQPPQNLRDASGSSQSHARPGAWSNGPGHCISMPSQQRQSYSGNPYSRDRMKDGITGKSRFGNPTARQTVVPSRRTSDHFVDGPPAKRQRTETSSSSHAIPNTATSSRGHRASQRVGNKSVSRTMHPSGVEVNVIDDDEDIGVHITRKEEPASSPDPLRLSMDSTKSPIFPGKSRPSRSGAHPFDIDDDMTSGPPHITDSYTVQQLRQRNAERKRKPEINEIPDSESDDIEEFDDDVKANSSKRRQSSTQQNKNVRTKIQFYEAQEEKKVPHVDLTSVNKPRSTRSVAGNMKPRTRPPEESNLAGLRFTKLTSVNQGLSDPDTISAPSFGAPKSNRSAAAEKVGPSLMLPLEAWSLGVKILPEENDTPPPRDFLCWEEKTSVVTIRRRPIASQPLFPLEAITVNGQVREIQVTNQDPKLPENVVIQLRSEKYTRKSGAFMGSDKFYTPGSRQSNGFLTFKFLKDDRGWDDSRYQRLVAFLRKQVSPGKFSTVQEPGANIIWFAAQEAAQMKMHIERKDSETTRSGTRRPSVQLDNTPAAGSRPKPRPAYKGTNGSVADLSEPVRRSSRQASAQKSASTDPDELILVYPPSGNGAINITQGDLNRLEKGEYLNDTLIEFGLKLWLNEIRAQDPELADQIHVFSSFFYKKLKNNTKNPEEGYQSVRKWTQKFDLFKKKYLIVPINENLHWYLAIVYQPEHVLLASPPTMSASVSTRTRKNQSGIVEQQVLSSTTPNSSPPPQDRTRDTPTVRLPSSATGDGKVEEMFDRSCSISVDQITPTATSSTSDQKDREDRQAPEADSTVVDDDGELHQLQYPSPDTRTSQMDMDVDELAGDKVMDEGNIHQPSITSSRSLDMDAGSRAESEKTNSVSSNSGAVRATSFYSSVGGKGKEKADSRPRSFPLNFVDVSCSDDGEQDEVDELLNELDSSVQPEKSMTYIFTLDSLGSKHPQAIKFLRKYLKMEAKDKKGIVDSSDAKGLQVFVPVQPNFCDCGLYLLHLAKTFVKRPEYHRQVILSRSKKSLVERQEEWDDVDARDFRNKFKSQVEELSQTWKKEYAIQAQKGRDGDKQDSSDSEVDIVEDTTQKAKVAPSKQTKAARIRG